MEHFTLTSTVKSKPCNNVYLSLDSIEGSNCFGHWMIECALFLPYLDLLRKKSPKPIKILLHKPARYKKVVLSDFGVLESDVVYSKKMNKIGPSWQETVVFPEEDEYIMYMPHYTFCWKSNVTSKDYLSHIEAFRKHYMKSTIDKTIDVLYLKRSSKENYPMNFRNFKNLESLVSLANANSYAVLDVDTLHSLVPQIDIVRRSKILIMEQGSALTINAGWFAENSTIIVLNDGWDILRGTTPFMEVLRLQAQQRNNMYIVCPNNTSGSIRKGEFEVDIDKLDHIVKKSQFVRNICIICDSPKLDVIASFPNFPTMAISNSTTPNSFYDKTIVKCAECKCVMLKNLVDPAVLYSPVYTNASFSPIWAEHHKCFASFLLKNSTDTDFLEIGANTGTLYNIMKSEREISYSVLDMFRHPSLPTDIKFVQDNCENYDYIGCKNVILSHVFEHLYNPKILISKLSSARVANVFISIPNFEKLYTEKSSLILNSQHTFYCGKAYIDFIFSKFNYKCSFFEEFDKGVDSYMIKYSYNNTYACLPVPKTELTEFNTIYVTNINKLRALTIPETYVMPSGIYGQYFYSFISNKAAVIGFLDNNLSRHGNMLFGTDKKVYHPSKVDLNGKNVVVCECPYKEEIVRGLLTAYPTVNIIHV